METVQIKGKPYQVVERLPRAHVHYTPHDHDIRVFVDGVDVSDDCFAADARRGLALCFDRNGDGDFYLHTMGEREKVAASIRLGKVEIYRVKPVEV